MTYEDIVTLIVAAVVLCLCSIVSTALFIKESDRCCRLRRENQKLRRLLEQRIQMAVSYTHLDVYKRQTLERHRKYMVALLLIYTNGYEIIRGHLKQVMKGVAVR